MRADRVRGLQEDDLKVPRTLIEKNGKLFLRVRRNRGWKRIELESDPRTWEAIVTWSLSPPGHDDHRRLRTLQQHIFADSQMSLVDESDLNGIRFLREVISNNDRARLDSENNQIVVEGTSGLNYAVIPGRGGHNTRFVVSPMRETRRNNTANAVHGWARMRQRMADGHNAICIVETRQLRRLVLGDALGSITLSLLDDLESSKYINTLFVGAQTLYIQPADTVKLAAGEGLDEDQEQSDSSASDSESILSDRSFDRLRVCIEVSR